MPFKSIIRAAACAFFAVGVMYTVSNLIQGHGYPMLGAFHHLSPATDRWDRHTQFLLDQFLNLILCGVLAYLVAPKTRAKK